MTLSVTWSSSCPPPTTQARPREMETSPSPPPSAGVQFSWNLPGPGDSLFPALTSQPGFYDSVWFGFFTSPNNLSPIDYLCSSISASAVIILIPAWQLCPQQEVLPSRPCCPRRATWNLLNGTKWGHSGC